MIWSSNLVSFGRGMARFNLLQDTVDCKPFLWIGEVHLDVVSAEKWGLTSI